jgi:drug/metabolite transporter (DMT)-like permease
MTLDRQATSKLTFACAKWGLSFPVGKALLMVQENNAPGLDSAFHTCVSMVLRFGLAAVVMLLILLGQRRHLTITLLEWYQGLGVAFFAGFGMLFQLDGLAHTAASTSAFLTQGSVIFIPLATALIHQRWPTRRILLCILLAIAGVAVLADFDWKSFHLGRGELETLVSAAFFSGHIMWLERPMFRANDSLPISLVMFTGITFLCFPMIFLHSAPVGAALQSVSTPSAWLLIGMLVGPCSLLAFLTMNRWQRHVSATKAALIYCLEPVFASIMALFLPLWLSQMVGLRYANEQLTVQLMIGGGFILLANIFMQWPAEQDASHLNERAVTAD